MALRIVKGDTIERVQDLVNRLYSKNSNDRLLFRGQNVDKPLVPKIARGRAVDYEALKAKERRMLERFQKEAQPFLAHPLPQTVWDWLSIAQHQGMPTRLLDWSGNALAALWFAVSNDPGPKVKQGVVWVLKVDPKNLTSPSEDEDIFDLRRTYVFQPFHIDRRIAAQTGWFSVHKYVESSGRFIALEKNAQYRERLLKFVIPVKHFESIRRELRRLGFTQASMFPDLSGLCADIQQEFLGEARDVDEI